MKKRLKLINIVLAVIATTCMVTSTVYSQKNYNSKINEDKGIVHNDQTGIVLNVVEKYNNVERKVQVQDNSSGKRYMSIPTRIKLSPGDRVIYRVLNHNICRIERACKE